MAELHVQRKDRNVWPWILAAVILVAVVFWFWQSRNDSPGLAQANATDSTMAAAPQNADVGEGYMAGTNEPGNMAGAAATGGAAGTLSGTAVVSFLQFVDARSSRTAGLAHEYTSDGLRQLAAALNEIADRDSVGGIAVRPRISEIRDRANAMQQNPTSTEHALQTREAFVLASSLMAQMKMGSANGNGTLQSLQNAAMAIRPSVQLLEQKDVIEQFFAEAAKTIRSTDL